MQYVWMAIIGFIVGLVARALLPGDQKIGMIMTAVLGITGSFIANYGGQTRNRRVGGHAAGLHRLGGRGGRAFVDDDDTARVQRFG